MRESRALVDVREMAEILKITPNTIHSKRWQARSGCPLFKCGKRLFAEEPRFWEWMLGRRRK